MNKLILLASLLLAALFAYIVVGIIVAHYHQQAELERDIKAIIQQKEAQSAMFDEINRQLNLKHADDCVLESTRYGFSCREIRTGKLFKIKL